MIFNKKNQLQRFLDSNKVKSPVGNFYIKESLIQSVPKPIDWRGTTIWTDKNTSVLKVQTSKFSHSYLTIDVTQVKNPSQDKRLITIYIKNRNVQWSYLNNIDLVGSEKHMIGVDRGFTGIFVDSTTDSNGTLKTKGEFHFNDFKDITFRFLHTGLLLSNNPKDNHRKASTGANKYDIKGIGVKRLAVFDDSSGGSELRYSYQNRYVLTEEEKDFDLVSINTKWMHIYPRGSDMNKGNKPRDKFAHKYLLSNYKDPNTVYDLNSYLLPYIKDTHLKRLNFK